MNDTVLQWLENANQDLVLVQKIISDEYLTALALFHCQQAVEKSLKALIEHHNMPLPRIHSLERLFEIVKDLFQYNYDSKILGILDNMYIDSRYPINSGILFNGKPTLEDVEKLYNFASSVHSEIKKLLKTYLA